MKGVAHHSHGWEKARRRRFGSDVREAWLMQGQLVDLTNRHGGVERVARAFMVAPSRIPRGCVATYFPEANVLVPIGSVATKNNTPTSKFVVITISPSPPSVYVHRVAVV